MQDFDPDFVEYFVGDFVFFVGDFVNYFVGDFVKYFVGDFVEHFVGVIEIVLGLRLSNKTICCEPTLRNPHDATLPCGRDDINRRSGRTDTVTQATADGTENGWTQTSTSGRSNLVE